VVARYGLPEGVETRQTQPRTRVVLLTLSVFLVGAITAGVVVATSGGSTVPGAGIAPANLVVSSAQNTLAKHRADVVFSGSVSVAAQVIPLNGWGRVDFTTNAFSGTVSARSSTISYVERELLAHGHFYMRMTMDGHDVSQITGGAEWIDLPVVDQGGGNSPGLGIIDPLTQLHVLAKKGATVVPIGTSVIDGDTVSGYSVTPSRSQVLQALGQEFASGQFSPVLEQQILNAPKALGSFTSDVWFDASGILRRQVMTLGGGMTGATGRVDMTYQYHGAPVSIKSPAPDNVISYSQFSSDLQLAINKAT
jgi:hypothetical protein